MPAMGTPVTLVPNGTPVAPGTQGIAVTIVGGGDFAVVNSGSTIPLTGPDGSRAMGSGTAVVSSGAVQRVTLPAGSTVITDQAGAITVSDADGTSVDCSATIVPQTGFLSFVGLPGTAALVTSNMSVKMADFGGGGPVDGVVQITGGFINWVSLANQTDTILSNGFAGDVTLGPVSGAGSDYATINIAAGTLSNVAVSYVPTKALVESGVPHTVPVTGTYVDTITPTVVNGAVTGFTLS